MRFVNTMHGRKWNNNLREKDDGQEERNLNDGGSLTWLRKNIKILR